MNVLRQTFPGYLGSVRIGDIWRAIVVAGVALVALYFAPLAIFFFLALGAVTLGGRRDGAQILLVTAACLLFSLLNLTKGLSGDLINYINLAEYLSHRPADVLLNAKELAPIGASYRITEIGYHGVVWVLSHVFHASRVLLAVGGTLAVYLPTYFALRILRKHEAWPADQWIAVVFFTLFAAVNFLDATHLLRQYISASIAFLAFGMLVATRRRASIALAGYACAVHNGTIIPILDVAGVIFLLPQHGFRKFTSLSIAFRVAALIVLMAVSVVATVVEEFHHGPQQGFAQISLIHYVVAGGLWVLAVVGYLRYGRESRCYHYALSGYGVIFAVSVTFFVFHVQLLALRYFDYLQWLQGIMIACALAGVSKDQEISRLLSNWAICGAGACIFLWRFWHGPWLYGPHGHEIWMLDWRELVQYLAQ